MPTAINPVIDQGIALFLLAPKTILVPATKEVVAEVTLGGAWFNRTLRKLIRTGSSESNPGDIRNAVSIIEHPSPFLIVTVDTSPPCGLDTIHQVANKRQSNFLGLVRQTQKLDAVVDGRLTDDLDSESIFSKLIGHKIYNGSSGDLYMRCRMNFAADPVQTQTPQFMYLGISTINALDKSSGLSTPATRFQRSTNGANWSAQYHVFGEVIAVGVSETKSYLLHK